MSIWKEMVSQQKEERKRLVAEAIEKYGSKSEAARHLGISRQQINQFVNQHNLEKKSKDD